MLERSSWAAELGLGGHAISGVPNADAAHYCAAMTPCYLEVRGIPIASSEALAMAAPPFPPTWGGIRECLTPGLAACWTLNAEDSAYADAVLELAGVSGPQFAAVARRMWSGVWQEQMHRRANRGPVVAGRPT